MIYNNQKKAANECYEFFKEGYNRVLLYAQMQSGKTGTYAELINIFYHSSPLGRSANYMVIISDNLLEIKEKIIKDLKRLINPKIKVDVYDITSFKKGKHKERLQQLKNVFIVHDESHGVQGEEQTINRVFREYFGGSFLENKRKDLFILHVSATPFSEKMDKNLPTVILEPDHNYYGIEKMFQNGVLRDPIEITTIKNKKTILHTNLVNLLKDYNKKNKYIILRSEKIHKIQNLDEQLKQYNFDVIYINKDKKELNLTERVKIVPKKPTLIILKQMARKGIEVESKNISCVIDTDSKNVDTVVQSLLGRMCGYHKEADSVIIYTNIKAAEEMLKWVKGLPAKIKTEYLNSKVSEYEPIRTITTEMDFSVYPEGARIKDLVREVKEIKELEEKYKHELHTCRLASATSHKNNGDYERFLNSVKNNGSCDRFIEKHEKFTVLRDENSPNKLFIIERREKEKIEQNWNGNGSHFNPELFN